MATHYWVSAPLRADRDRIRATLELPSALAVVDAHRRLRGPYTVAGTLLRLVGPDVLARCPELGARHYIEIQETTPELIGRVPPIVRRLESAAAPGEVSRYAARLHTLRVSHGLADLLQDYLRVLDGGPRALIVENAHEADPTDQEFLAVLIRRIPAEWLTIVVCSAGQLSADLPGPATVSLPEAIERHAHRVADAAPQPAEIGEIGVDEVTELARRYVNSDGTSDKPRERAAYDLAGPRLRAALHDERGALLAAIPEPSLQLGAIPYHAERGSDPAGAGAAALKWAQTRCKNLGFYHSAAEYGARGLKLVDREAQPELWWKFIVETAVCLAAGGRPAEAEALHEQARMASVDPIVHMKLAYETAMLYARHYDGDRRNPGLARAWVNQAIAIASWISDPKERAFYSVFYRNGLALVETRVGRVDEALQLLDEGIERLDRELGLGERTMHRTGLRYNRAQVNSMSGRLEEALADYTAVMRIDDTFSDHYFNRGNILRKLGRVEEAIADYEQVFRLEPPFPEVYYNRGDAFLELGEEDRALADFSRAIELDPGYAIAWLARASILADRGEAADALRDVLAGLAAEPGNAQLMCLQGRLLAERGDIAAARRVLTAALDAEPGLAEAWAILGQVAFQDADLDAAIAALDRAVDLCDAPEMRYNRAVVNQAAGKLSAAIADLDVVVEVTDDTDARHRRDLCRDAVTAGRPAAS